MKSNRKPKAIEARSVVSARNLEPYITVFLLYDDGTEEPVTQWTPEDAMHHARAVMETAEAAISDAFLVSFLTAKIGVTVEEAVRVLPDFRAWRDRARPPETTQ